jgi:hypothetical protein
MKLLNPASLKCARAARAFSGSYSVTAATRSMHIVAYRRVNDQWTEMSRRDGDEPMVDVLKISFMKKTVTDGVWQSESPHDRP